MTSKPTFKRPKSNLSFYYVKTRQESDFYTWSNKKKLRQL